MTGNCHVQFLGGNEAERPLTYPIQKKISMSKLEQKLKENRNRRAREAFLSVLDQQSGFCFSKVHFSSDVSQIKNAAYVTWDNEAHCQTTTRGSVKGWQYLTFKIWQDLIYNIKSFSLDSNLSGWFFTDTDGPFYHLSKSDFFNNLDSISEYCLCTERFDFGWVGSDIDFGIITEFNHTSFCRNEFDLCFWGI